MIKETNEITISRLELEKLFFPEPLGKNLDNNTDAINSSCELIASILQKMILNKEEVYYVCV